MAKKHFTLAAIAATFLYSPVFAASIPMRINWLGEGEQKIVVNIDCQQKCTELPKIRATFSPFMSKPESEQLQTTVDMRMGLLPNNNVVEGELYIIPPQANQRPNAHPQKSIVMQPGYYAVTIEQVADNHALAEKSKPIHLKIASDKAYLLGGWYLED